MHKSYHFIDSIKLNNPCEVCHLAKQKHLPFCNSTSKTVCPFEITHVDIWGPISIPSTFGHKYFLAIVDDFKRYTLIFLMKSKAEASIQTQHFVSLVETQCNSKVKCIRSDNGKEFLMTNFNKTKGIIHQTSCVETPQQNGVVERKHQHLLAVARALIFQAKLPKIFWNYAIAHAVFLINRLPSKVIKNETPYTLLYKQSPDISMLKVFGCLCYASTLTANRKKLDPRA